MLATSRIRIRAMVTPVSWFEKMRAANPAACPLLRASAVPLATFAFLRADDRPQQFLPGCLAGVELTRLPALVDRHDPVRALQKFVQFRRDQDYSELFLF